jgi:hypothetical protein
MSKNHRKYDRSPQRVVGNSSTSVFNFVIEPFRGGMLIKECGKPHAILLPLCMEHAIEAANLMTQCFRGLSPALKAFFQDSTILFMQFGFDEPDQFEELDLRGNVLPKWKPPLCEVLNPKDVL